MSAERFLTLRLPD